MTEQEELHSSIFHLPELLESVAEAFGTLALGKGVEILLDISPEACVEVRGDAEKLRRIIRDLLHAACSFTQEGAIIIGAGLADWCRHTVTARFKIVLSEAEPFFDLQHCQELVAGLGGKLSALLEPGHGYHLSFAVPLERVIRKAEGEVLATAAA